jgi:hypothetical protein
MSWSKVLRSEEIIINPGDDYRIVVTHHDLSLPGYEEFGCIDPLEIDGINLVVNGHIHRQLENRVIGGTTWANPGNISRISRSDANKSFVPQALQLTYVNNSWVFERIEVPHEPFDSVFHQGIAPSESQYLESVFVQGLAELQARRTESGAGLKQFLESNLLQFEEDVREEIESLAIAILADEPKEPDQLP